MSNAFTDIHFSLIIKSSCVMETNCSSCWWIVFLFASHQYCLCVDKKWMCIVCKPSIQKVRSAVKVFYSCQGWSCANTDSIIRYSVANHFLSSCEWRSSCGDDSVLLLSMLVMCKHRFCNAHCCIANHFCALVSMISSAIWTTSLQ